MSLADASARGAKVTFLGQAGKFVLQVTSTLILARLLDESDFGLYAMVVAISGVAALLSDFGLSMAAIRAHDATTGQRNNLFWLNALLGAIAMVVVFAAADLIALAYGNGQLAQIARIIAPIYFLQAILSQFYAESARVLRFNVLAVSEIIAQATALAVSVCIALAGGGYWALVAQALVVVVVNLAIIAPGSKWRPGPPRRRESMKALLSFAGNSAGVQVLNYFSANVDTFVLGRVWGPAVTGVYGQAFQLFKVPLQQLASPLTRVAVPVLSQVKDDARFQGYVNRAQLVLVYALAGSFTLAAATSTPLMSLILGPGWDGAAEIFTVLALGGIFQALGYVYYWVLLARALTGIQLRIAVVSRTLMVILIVAGVGWGALGVALASSLGLALNWALLTIFAVPRSRLQIRPLIVIGARAIGMYLFAFVVTIIASRVLPLSLWPIAELGVLVPIFMVACAPFFLFRRYRLDMRDLVDTVRRMRRRR